MYLAAVAMKLAGNTPEAMVNRQRYEAKEITKEEYEKNKSLEKNRIPNISWVSPGHLVGSSWGNTLNP